MSLHLFHSQKINLSETNKSWKGFPGLRTWTLHLEKGFWGNSDPAFLAASPAGYIRRLIDYYN